ncbi:MAG: hypothetical protein LAT75_07035 [Candidatus Cyclonatronum sp.]|uniref:hypothetical protein n=1 Tax=Cyclonatronum sp. TaxID=3024185 RepID=UPI0025C18484|nr:hypothetical protein [Cyclonatronum sp.]MCC5932918.1 hypothetical protein [Balneolales bacterium]MCH8486603.1 hypothetical protein [Cyclonatronum sp.]
MNDNKFRKIRFAAAGLIFLFGLLLILPAASQAQFTEAMLFNTPHANQQILTESDARLFPVVKAQPNPGRAMLRSFVLPGWGQYYADSSDWRRGQYHLGADLLLIGSLMYLSSNASILQNNIYAHARSYAGIDLRSVPRNVELAVASSNSLASYNEAQLRSRNWDRLIDDVPANRWQWQTEESRGEFLRLRDRKDRAERQIPAVVTLMVVNRVVSGVHAFITARNQSSIMGNMEIGISLPESGNGSGYEARLLLRF